MRFTLNREHGPGAAPERTKKRTLSGRPLVPGTNAPSWHELVQGPHPDGPAAVHPPQTRPWNRPRHRHVVTVELVKGAGPGQRRERRAARRANGASGEYGQRIVTRSPRALPVAGAGVRMAAYRAHQPLPGPWPEQPRRIKSRGRMAP